MLTATGKEIESLLIKEMETARVRESKTNRQLLEQWTKEDIAEFKATADAEKWLPEIQRITSSYASKNSVSSIAHARRSFSMLVYLTATAKKHKFTPQNLKGLEDLALAIAKHLDFVRIR
jgi:hypothetical protein